MVNVYEILILAGFCILYLWKKFNPDLFKAYR